MSSFAVCLNAVLPLFLVMGLGYIARCTGAISRTDVPKINKWAFKFFMPVMLFYNIYTSDLSAAVQPKLIAYTAACLLVLYGLSFAYVMATEKCDNMRGVMIQGIYRSNFVIMGIPLAAQLVPVRQPLVDFPLKAPFRRFVELAAGHLVRKVVLAGEGIRRVVVVRVILPVAQLLHQFGGRVQDVRGRHQ